MTSFLTVFIALVSLLLMAAILVQNPKGGGIDSTFGGQAQQIFGASQSADFIEKATWWLLGLLFALCIISTMTVSGGSMNPSDIQLIVD